jgi:hypothetical protein
LSTASQEEELDVLCRILGGGIDQGCFLRPPPEHLIALTPEQQETLYAALEDRDQLHLPGIESVDGASPAEPPIVGDEPGWTILTQSCDLLRPYCMEPVVELAHTSLIEPDKAGAARLNSPRLIWLCDHTDGRCWMVDLRRRVLLPKHLLLQSTSVQPLADARTRKLFRHRISQRYGRDPVPDDIVERLQKPLKKVFSGSTAKAALASHFFALLAVRDGDKLLLLALRDDDKAAEPADKAFAEILQRLREADADHTIALAEESTVVTAGDLSLDLWLKSCKLGLDEISYGRRAGDGHAQPRV